MNLFYYGVRVHSIAATLYSNYIASLHRTIHNFLLHTIFFLPFLSLRSSLLYKAWTEAGIDEQFAKTTWGQKIANQNKRKELTDFDRFVVKTLKAKKNKIIAKKVKELKAKK